MRTSLLCVVLLLGMFGRPVRADDSQALLEKLDELKRRSAQREQLLREVTAERWALRQKHVAAKQNDKDALDELRYEMERLYADVARGREEVFSREEVLADETAKLQHLRQEWRYVAETVGDKLEKSIEGVALGFPLQREARMRRLNAIAAPDAGGVRALRTLDALMRYRFERMRDGLRIGLARRTFVVDGDEPVTAQVLRIGQAMAYGVTPEGHAYYLGGTGRIGAQAFVWRQMENPAAIAALSGAFPAAMETGRLDTQLPVDILRNRYSESVLTHGRQSWVEAVRVFIVAGGPVLVPLLVVVLWAAVLIVNRLLTYTSRHRRDYHFMNTAIELLEQGEQRQAAALATERKSVLARILARCLEHSRWSRGAAEKVVHELLLAEMPVLDRHLDTLAVLAAAAPLLGLLGTVTGMIEMFEAITRFGTADPKLLAGGISEALITTEVGLAVAIPVLLIHNYLRNRRNRIQAHLEMYAMRILNRLWPEEEH